MTRNCGLYNCYENLNNDNFVSTILKSHRTSLVLHNVTN